MQLFSCQLHVSQRKASTPEVSENFLCLLELEMFPMCTSNDPARFALKGNFPHHLEYSTIYMHVYLFRHGSLGWVQINVHEW